MIALSTGSLNTYGVARVFDLASRASYDGIEIMVDRRWDTRHSHYLRQLSTDHALPIVALHSPFLSLDASGWPDDEVGRLQQTVLLAQSLGIPIVVAHLPFRFNALVGRWYGSSKYDFVLNLPVPRRVPYSRFLCDDLTVLEGESGVTVAVENMPARWLLGMRINGYAFNSPAELSRFPHLTLDTTHLGTWGMDPLKAYTQLRERVVHVHLSNIDGADGKRLKEHRSPPDGRLPLAEFLRALALDGYRGAITVETGPEAMSADDEEGCLQALRRALEFCRDHFE